MSNDEKLKETIISFKGDAPLWYQWESKRYAMFLWEEMKILLLHQFPTTKVVSFHEQWLALEWDESQVTCHGEEQASEHVPKPKSDVVQVGPDTNGRRQLRILG